MHLIHRQETMSFLGFPIIRHIDIDDSESVLKAIRGTPPGRERPRRREEPAGARRLAARHCRRWEGSRAALMR